MSKPAQGSGCGLSGCYSTKTNSRNCCSLTVAQEKLLNEQVNFSSLAPLPLQQTEPSCYPVPPSSGTQNPSSEATSLKKISSFRTAGAFQGLALPTTAPPATPRCSHSPLPFGEAPNPVLLPIFYHPTFTHQPTNSSSSSSLHILSLPLSPHRFHAGTHLTLN